MNKELKGFLNRYHLKLNNLKTHYRTRTPQDRKQKKSKFEGLKHYLLISGVPEHDIYQIIAHFKRCCI